MSRDGAKHLSRTASSGLSGSLPLGVTACLGLQQGTRSVTSAGDPRPEQAAKLFLNLFCWSEVNKEELYGSLFLFEHFGSVLRSHMSFGKASDATR